jgi:hypothetical protein
VSSEEVWFPLVDEPIGAIVQELEREQPEIRRLISTPRQLLAFRTFAYIRIGILLGRLLVDNDLPPYDGTATWVDRLLEDPRHRERIAREVRAVADAIAADARYGEDEPLGPDDEARSRFRDFARRRLERS